MTHVETAELLGVREAARALGLNASTVSRYLRDHPDLNHDPDAPRPKVDVEEFRQHRADYTNPARRGSHAGRLFGEGDDLDADPGDQGDDEADEGKGKEKNKLTYSLAKATREAILAQRARIDLDEKRALLVPRAEIEAAVYEAGQMLQRDLLELGPQLSERLAAMASPHDIAALMETEHRRLLAKWASTLRTQGDADVAA